MCPTTLAAVVLAVLLIIVVSRRSCRDGFKARTEDVYPVALNVFTKKGADVPFSDFKAAVPGTDPVEYSDLKAVWKRRGASGFTMESVDKVTL